MFGMIVAVIRAQLKDDFVGVVSYSMNGFTIYAAIAIAVRSTTLAGMCTVFQHDYCFFFRVMLCSWQSVMTKTRALGLKLTSQYYL